MRKTNGKRSGLLTVEAALVLPLFVFLVATFFYVFQVFYLQEYIQRSITSTGLSMAKAAYAYEDIYDFAVETVNQFEENILGEGLELGIMDMATAAVDGTFVKLLTKKELDVDKINHSCIQGGYSGLSFYNTKVLDDNDCIDIIVRYRVKIPIRIFGLSDMRMVQRVRLRGWTGHKVTAKYSYTPVQDETETETETKTETMVYVAETGRVYHLTDSCTYIKLSIKEVSTNPESIRNLSGGKYYPCEICMKHGEVNQGKYYITDYGDRYHKVISCSGIKRTVSQVPYTSVSHMRVCSRCKGK